MPSDRPAQTRRNRARLRRNAERAKARTIAVSPFGDGPRIEGICETPIAGEADHFFRCEDCGQLYDRRDLGQVLYHVEPAHRPHPLS